MLFVTRFTPKRVVKFIIVFALLCICLSSILNNQRTNKVDQKIKSDLKDTNKSVTNSFIDNEVLKDTINTYNTQPIINNFDFFNYRELPEDLLVLLVQVHDRFKNLEALIDSLKDAVGVNKTLVIFSHDYYDEDINDLIQSIEFCATVQIFYPFMLQSQEVSTTGITDRYGHERNPRIAQIKHHWFWKISFVFDKFSLTQSLTKLKVLLLEEDFYLYPDTFYIIDKLNKISDAITAGDSIIELGSSVTSLHPIKYNTAHYYKSCTNYTSTFSIVVKRSIWNRIKVYYKEFCEYDDYNWDW